MLAKGRALSSKVKLTCSLIACFFFGALDLSLPLIVCNSFTLSFTSEFVLRADESEVLLVFLTATIDLFPFFFAITV